MSDKLFTLTEREAGQIEGYAQALESVMHALTGEGWSPKEYDIKDYESVDEIKTVLFDEVISELAPLQR